MTAEVTLETICTPSADIVARVIEGEIVIVPLVAGIGDADDELYSLNPTGQAIWNQLDGQRTLKEIAEKIVKEFSAPLPDIENDVLGFARELVHRGILATKVR
jgi:hypothetical protein